MRNHLAGADRVTRRRPHRAPEAQSRLRLALSFFLFFFLFFLGTVSGLPPATAPCARVAVVPRRPVGASSKKTNRLVSSRGSDVCHQGLDRGGGEIMARNFGKKKKKKKNLPQKESKSSSKNSRRQSGQIAGFGRIANKDITHKNLS